MVKYADRRITTERSGLFPLLAMTAVAFAASSVHTAFATSGCDPDETPPAMTVGRPDGITLEISQHGHDEGHFATEFCRIDWIDECRPSFKRIHGITAVQSSDPTEQISGEPGNFHSSGIGTGWYKFYVNLDSNRGSTPRTYTITYTVADEFWNLASVECQVRVGVAPVETGDEICDGVDSDDDGEIDEGCNGCPAFTTVPHGWSCMPAGEFTMGTHQNEVTFPPHLVEISRNLLMKKTEVTQNEWQAVMGTTPWSVRCLPDCPVDQVSWYDAILYLNRLSELQGFLSCYQDPDDGSDYGPEDMQEEKEPTLRLGCNGYRLPTEAEWEYAARAGTDTDFWSGDIGDTRTCSPLNTTLDAVGWYCGNSETAYADHRYHSVGLKAANPWGLYDVHGNVREWVWDWFVNRYEGLFVDPSVPVSDPLGPMISPAGRRVTRGGAASAFSLASECQAFTRVSVSPDKSGTYIGFRPVRTIVEGQTIVNTGTYIYQAIWYDAAAMTRVFLHSPLELFVGEYEGEMNYPLAVDPVLLGNFSAGDAINFRLESIWGGDEHVANSSDPSDCLIEALGPDHWQYTCDEGAHLDHYNDLRFEVFRQGLPGVPIYDRPSVIVGYQHACAMQANGMVDCWGRNGDGQSTPPDGEFAQVEAGRYHTCGLRPEASAECWGLSTNGRLSPPDERFRQISAGGCHTCAVLENQEIACWGCNDDNQASPPAGAFLRVSAGQFHTCGLRVDDSIECWGRNESGQNNAVAGQFLQVSSGLKHSCGLANNGGVTCWGSNSNRQLEAPDDQDFVDLSASWNHACARRANGTVACWGKNNVGQATPPEGMTFAKIAAGGGNTCALTYWDAVECWGLEISEARDYEEIRKVLAGDGAAGDKFGRSIAIYGDTTVVGAPHDDDGGNDSGSAYIFERNEEGADNWGFVKKLIASDGAAGDQFGRSVDIDGDTIVVGAIFEDENGIYSGSSYIFDRNRGGANNWGETRKIDASDGVADDYFGRIVVIGGDTVAVGAHGDDDHGASSGSVYIFDRNRGGADNWGETKKITANDGAALDGFGYSVAIDHNTVAVGSTYDDDGGNPDSVYLFDRDQGGTDNWGETRKITAGNDPASDYGFGYSVSIGGDTLVVGAVWGIGNEGYPGSAYIFDRNRGGANNWGETRKITGSESVNGGRFGYSVSISDNIVVVGAVYDNDDGDQSGSAYIFDRNQGGTDHWGERIKLTANDGAAGDNFGSSVSTSGGTVFVGASGNNDGGNNSGSAYVFE